MQEHEFVSAVQQSTDLPDQESAERAVRATLAVLGQRLAGGETKDLRGQLPGGLKEYLPAEGGGERFDVSSFYERVATEEGEGVTVANARQHARATVKALEVALSDGEWTSFTAQLPSEYSDLLGTDEVQNH